MVVHHPDKMGVAGSNPVNRIMNQTVLQFMHHLHDTVILLGGDKRIAELLNHPELITEKDVDDLRKYTCGLIDATKTKLVSLNTITVRVG